MARPLISNPPATRFVRIRWRNSTWRPRVTVVPRWHKLARIGRRPARMSYRSLTAGLAANHSAKSRGPRPLRASLIRLRRALRRIGQSYHPRNGFTRRFDVRIASSPEPRSLL